MSASVQSAVPAGRVAVIGDVGGQLVSLRTELERLGADPDSGKLPADLTVVQVGDAIHRGPDSEGVVELIDGYLRTQPQQWVQLVGNHEAQYLYAPTFDWPERISDEAAGTLLDWWTSRVMRPAVAVSTPGEQFLITHAGLTEGFWEQLLDSPASPVLAAAALNSFAGLQDQVLFSPGQMLGGGAPNFCAGPVWAAEGTELIPSWQAYGADLPFSQIHGHSSVMNWWRQEISCPPKVAAAITVDMDTAHTFAKLPGGRIIGVDPGHSRRPNRFWNALVLQNATVQ